MKLHAFVAMPFGIKRDANGVEIDFNRVYIDLIKPALESAGLESFRADEEERAGDIRTDMFQELLVADLVVVDLTIDNPNVWYELGVRHALRARGVLLICGGRVTTAFDIYTDRKLRYGIKDGSLRKDCNLNLPLWQLVRASTAAPTYFPPEVVTFALGTPNEYRFVFVDGGITTYNNPAFQAFLMATMEPYKMNWPTGEDKMLVVSIGTGASPEANADLDPGEMNLLYNASSIPSALMYAALNEQDALCRVFGKCLAGDKLDREVGDLIGAKGPVYLGKLFTYMRYNAELSRKGLDGLGLSDIKPEDVQKLDSVAHIAELQRVGRAVAKKVNADHFAGFV